MSDVELTRRFTERQYAEATQSWHWLDLAGKTPLFTSAFGDIFFRAADGFWWLDTLEGTLTRPWRTAEHLQSELNTAEGQDQFLMTGLVHAAAQEGLVPGDDQIYDLIVSPVLGGPIDVANVSVIDFVVGVNIAGQLHDQVRGLPPGTPASGITIDDTGRLRLAT